MKIENQSIFFFLFQIVLRYKYTDKKYLIVNKFIQRTNQYIGTVFVIIIKQILTK